MLDHFAHQHKDAFFSGASRLRHIVGHNENGVLAPQCPDQLFDSLGPFGVQGGTRFIHQQNGWLHGQQPGDAELLLGFQTETNRGVLSLSLTSSHKKNGLQCLSTSASSIVFGCLFRMMEPVTKQHIVSDGKRKGLGR